MIKEGKEPRNIKYSRKSINCCIKRYKVKTPKEIEKELKKQKDKEDKKNNINTFEKVDEPGFIHIDFKYMPRIRTLNPDYKENIKGNNIEKDNRKYISNRSYMFAFRDRYTRWTYVEVLEDKSISNVVEFLKRAIKSFENECINVCKLA